MHETSEWAAEARNRNDRIQCPKHTVAAACMLQNRIAGEAPTQEGDAHLAACRVNRSGGVAGQPHVLREPCSQGLCKLTEGHDAIHGAQLRASKRVCWQPHD